VVSHPRTGIIRLRYTFGDTDSFGVTYPGDLEEYDRAVEGITMPDGFDEVYRNWRPPGGYSLLIRDSMHLEILAGSLPQGAFVQRPHESKRSEATLRTSERIDARVWTFLLTSFLSHTPHSIKAAK
jgi:hypothetical protein